MEKCLRYGGIERLFSSDCATEARYSNWTNQSNPCSAQLICPQPRRSFNSRSPINFDSFGYTDFNLDILDIIRSEDDSESESETNNETDFFYCESPPIRSTNPLVNDPEFQYMEAFYVSIKSSSSALKRPSRSYSPSFTSGPKMIIDGFSCGGSCDNSKSGRVLSAFA